MDFVEFQRTIEETYGELDRERGIPGTVAWLVEELGELAQAARKLGREEQLLELSDVLAWVPALRAQAVHVPARPGGVRAAGRSRRRPTGRRAARRSGWR
jgi:hypothetical protein